MDHITFTSTVNKIADSSWGQKFKDDKSAQQALIDEPQLLAAMASVELLKRLNQIARAVAADEEEDEIGSGAMEAVLWHPVFEKDTEPDDDDPDVLWPGGYWWIFDGDRMWTSEDLSLRFASKNDCQLACNALHEAGIDSRSKMRDLPDADMKRICCEALMW